MGGGLEPGPGAAALIYARGDRRLLKDGREDGRREREGDRRTDRG